MSQGIQIPVYLDSKEMKRLITEAKAAMKAANTENKVKAVSEKYQKLIKKALRENASEITRLKKLVGKNATVSNTIALIYTSSAFYSKLLKELATRKTAQMKIVKASLNKSGITTISSSQSTRPVRLVLKSPPQKNLTPFLKTIKGVVRLSARKVHDAFPNSVDVRARYAGCDHVLKFTKNNVPRWVALKR